MVNNKPKINIDENTKAYSLRRKREAIRKRKLARRQNIFLIITSLLMFFLLFQFVNQKILISKLSSKTNEIVEERKKLESEIDRLNKEIENANSLEYIEKKAREDLGMIKSGEKIYLDDKKDPKETKLETSQEESKAETGDSR